MKLYDNGSGVYTSSPYYGYVTGTYHDYAYYGNYYQNYSHLVLSYGDWNFYQTTYTHYSLFYFYDTTEASGLGYMGNYFYHYVMYAQNLNIGDRIGYQFYSSYTYDLNGGMYETTDGSNYSGWYGA